MMKYKKQVENITKFSLSLIIAGIFIYLLLAGIDYKEIKIVMKKANWVWIIFSCIFIPIGFLLRAYRWKYILNQVAKNISIKTLFNVLCVSQMTTNLLPFRAGDVVQVVYLGMKENVSKTQALASVAAERITDLFFLFLAFIFVSVFVKLSHQVKIIILFFVVFVCLFIYLYFLSKKVEQFITKLFPYVGNKLSLLNEGLRFFFNPKLVLVVMLLTIFQWILCILQVWIIFISFNIKISFTGIIAFLTIPSIMTIFPSTPGFIGVWDFFAVSTLQLFEISKEPALSSTVVLHFITLVAGSIPGIVFVLKEGFPKKPV